MSSHFARLKAELDTRQSELREHRATVKALQKLTEELEAQKQALADKSAELESRQSEVSFMKNRLEALAGIEPIIRGAMQTKSVAEDVVNHVMEQAIRSSHFSLGGVVQIALEAAVRVNGRTRSANIDDILIDLIDDRHQVKAAPQPAAATGYRTNPTTPQ